jgi:myo-inositol-hexaphosphate 3-phosphohydrolase
MRARCGRLDFDLNLHSIVMDQAKESSKHMMCRSYITHLSYRLIIRGQCSGIVRDTENGALSFGVHFNGVFQENTTPNRGAQLEALAMA